MSISDWQEQALRLEPLRLTDLVAASAPLVAVVPPPVRESSDVELGHRLAGDLAALTRVLLGPDLPVSLVVGSHSAAALPASVVPGPLDPTNPHLPTHRAPLPADLVDVAPVPLDLPTVPTEPVLLDVSTLLDVPAPVDLIAVPDTTSLVPAPEPAESFVAPPVVEIEPLFVDQVDVPAFVAPPVVEVEPLVPLDLPPVRPGRHMLEELSSLDL